ncbi:MAG TPA: zinc-binding dehydrogenase [Candidatus Dormibacteraeota bacterium]|nr:zinc-binding dehydrogenase [Candidatus Dormibacteraeota bacterium]
MKMNAAVLVAPGRIEVGHFDVPEPTPGGVLVRMRAASICGSDLHVIFDGFHRGNLGLPGYPGHEGVGEVVASDSPEFSPGQPVLTVPAPSEGNRCFAEYLALDARFVLPLPPDGDPTRLLLAQQLGTTIYAMRKFWPSGEGAACATVLGAGSAGLFFLQQLRAAGFEKVIVSDLEPYRLRVARELGADLAVHAPRESVVEATMDLTEGVGADLVIEAAGYDACRAQCVEAVRERGRIGFYGYPERPGSAPFPIELAFRKAPTIEFTVGTQREPALRSFREALRAIHEGRVEVGHCLEPRFPLARAPEAFATARERRPGAVKVGIDLAS